MLVCCIYTHPIFHGLLHSYKSLHTLLNWRDTKGEGIRICKFCSFQEESRKSFTDCYFRAVRACEGSEACGGTGEDVAFSSPVLSFSVSEANGGCRIANRWTRRALNNSKRCAAPFSATWERATRPRREKCSNLYACIRASWKSQSGC